jgi:UDP-N-acetylmuramate dehydrogenase
MTPASLKNPCAYHGEKLQNVMLADYTTWRVGGVAKCLYKPQSVDDLACFLQHLPPEEAVIWLGLGSNSLIRDSGFAGTIILTQGCLKNIELRSPNTVRVEAGVSCATMARFCARQNLGRAEFWAGIPGTMGGALRMNAGCFDGETWDHLIEVETLSKNGQQRRRTTDSFQIEYRGVHGLAQDEWFTAATFKLPEGDKATCLQTIKTLLDRRAQTQPTNEYNCGSVFRNPEAHHAGQLIEMCGLKGKNIEKSTSLETLNDPTPESSAAVRRTIRRT